MTPQMNHLRKMSNVVRVSTDIYGVSKEIDGKMFIFRVNLGMWPLKSIVLEKWPKTCTLNLQLLHNTKRPTKWSGHMKMIDPPRELLHRRDTMLPSILLVFACNEKQRRSGYILLPFQSTYLLTALVPSKTYFIPWKLVFWVNSNHKFGLAVSDLVESKTYEGQNESFCIKNTNEIILGGHSSGCNVPNWVI